VTVHPLLDAWTPVAAGFEWMTLQVGTALPPGASTVTDLAGPRLDDALAFARRSTGAADARTVAAGVVLDIREVLGAAAALLESTERVPQLDPARVGVRPWSEERDGVLVLPGPFACLAGDASAGHPDARVVADRQALERELAAQLDRVLDPLVEALHARTRFARRALWGIAAGGPGWSAGQAADALGRPDDAPAAARRATAGIEARTGLHPRLFVVRHAGRSCIGIAQAACCRAYRWDGSDHDVCTSCPLLSEDERAERLRRRLEGSAA